MPKNAVVTLTANGIITKRGHCALVHVNIVEIGASGSKLEIFTNNDGSGTPIYTVIGDGTYNKPHNDLWLTSNAGLYGKITTGGKYNVIFN